MNIPVLLQAKADILAHPDQFQMTDFFSNVLDVDDESQEPMEAGGCGTAACIAGWIMFRQLLARNEEGVVTVADAGDIRYPDLIDHLARDRAELTDEQGSRMFFVSGWPIDLKHRMWEAKSPEEFAAVAAERIDRFIETGGEE